MQKDLEISAVIGFSGIFFAI